MFEFYYTYDGTDYKIFPFDVTEGVGWKNVQGFPCNSISLVTDTTIPSPGRYRIFYSEANVGTYNGLIEACTLGAYENRSFDQRQCYQGVRTSNPVTITIDPTITYTSEVDNLEGNSNVEIISGLAIVLNEFPHFPNMFDIFYGGFYIATEERYLIPLDFGTVMRGETGAARVFTIKAVGALTNCAMQITDRGASQGSLVWYMKLNDNWHQGSSVVSLGNFSNNDEQDISLRCYVPLGWTEDATEGYLTLVSDEGVTSIPLKASFISPETIMDGETISDGELFFRCVILTAANVNKLYEFGITEAS